MVSNDSTRKQYTCPQCKIVFDVTDSFPFCCKRCKVLDLSGWLTERYKVSRPAFEEELAEEAPIPKKGDEEDGS